MRLGGLSAQLHLAQKAYPEIRAELLFLLIAVSFGLVLLLSIAATRSEQAPRLCELPRRLVLAAHNANVLPVPSRFWRSLYRPSVWQLLEF